MDESLHAYTAADPVERADLAFVQWRNIQETSASAGPCSLLLLVIILQLLTMEL